MNILPSLSFRPEADLHVIMVLSNACLYKRRYQLAKEFIARMEKTPHVRLYVVELAYGDQVYEVTQSRHPRHLQLRCDIPLWHKENMINLGVRRLLPPTWRAFAWIDADIEFLNPNWATDTLQALRKASIVQLFSEIEYLDANNKVYESYSGYFRSIQTSNVRGHSGFAWAIRRDAYEKLGGLIDRCILGGGDGVIAYGSVYMGNVPDPNCTVSPAYSRTINNYQRKFRGLTTGYVKGVIRHYFHGSLQNRKYTERWNVLRTHRYDPETFVTYNKHGLVVPTQQCPQGMLHEIMQYFRERNEDECFQTPADSSTATCPLEAPQDAAHADSAASP